MATQLLCRFDTEDFDAWRKAFDADAEDRREAGLSQLQLWREPGQPGRAWVLFRVNDPDRARAWAKAPATRVAADRAGVTASDAHFLETL